MNDVDSLVFAYHKPTDICICLRTDGSFVAGENGQGCFLGNGVVPSFNVAKTLNIKEGECVCC